MGKWSEMADKLFERDKNQVDEVNRYGPSIEERIELANGRGMDALQAIIQILKHLDEIDEADAARRLK